MSPVEDREAAYTGGKSDHVSEGLGRMGGKAHSVGGEALRVSEEAGQTWEDCKA